MPEPDGEMLFTIRFKDAVSVPPLTKKAPPDVGPLLPSNVVLVRFVTALAASVATPPPLMPDVLLMIELPVGGVPLIVTVSATLATPAPVYAELPLITQLVSVIGELALL